MSPPFVISKLKKHVYLKLNIDPLIQTYYRDLSEKQYKNTQIFILDNEVDLYKNNEFKIFFINKKNNRSSMFNFFNRLI
jgi:hypothetical protein